MMIRQRDIRLFNVLQIYKMEHNSMWNDLRNRNSEYTFSEFHNKSRDLELLINGIIEILKRRQTSQERWDRRCLMNKLKIAVGDTAADKKRIM